jgi:hypothetical protein
VVIRAAPAGSRGETHADTDNDDARVQVSRRGHYGFERRRREDLKRAKQAAKRLRKSENVGAGGAGPEIGEAQDSGAQPGLWEWFSPSRTRTVTSEPGVRPPADPPDDWVLLTDVEPDAGEEQA